MFSSVAVRCLGELSFGFRGVMVWGPRVGGSGWSSVVGCFRLSLSAWVSCRLGFGVDGLGPQSWWPRAAGCRQMFSSVAVGLAELSFRLRGG